LIFTFKTAKCRFTLAELDSHFHLISRSYFRKYLKAAITLAIIADGVPRLFIYLLKTIFFIYSAFCNQIEMILDKTI